MRDLDDLLDPTVSRRATAAARTPDFAVVERRGRQRRRRTRAMGVGAVAAVVAAVSVVGTQVASDRADTAPAEVPPGYDDPNGELERAAESGDADVVEATVGAGDSVLTVWSRIVSGNGDAPAKKQYGFGLAADGETLWSRFEAPVGIGDAQQFAASPLPDGGFVVARSARQSASPLLVDADGLHVLEVRTGPADLSSGEYDGFVLGQGRMISGRIYAVDRETASLTPVAELAGVRPVWTDYLRGFASTPDGVWAVTWTGRNLLHLSGDGVVTRYPFEGSLLGLVVGDDNRVAVLSSADGRTLELTVVENGRASSHVLRLSPRRLGFVLGAAVLPDGRLLVHAGESLLRSTDASWRAVDDLGAVRELPLASLDSFTLQPADGRACLVPVRADTGDPMPATEARCTVDGETWEAFDLTP